MQTLLRTPLYDRHVAAEHRAVRRDCGVFDVSHMGELFVEGPKTHDFLQGLLANDLDRVGEGGAQYTLLTNERGGIVDDLIAYRLDEQRCRYLLIVNASNRETDFRWLKERELAGTEVSDRSDEYALLAVQGPRAIERLGLPDAKPFTFAEAALDGVEVMVNRTGYTGEDGGELLSMAEDGARLWDAVLARGIVPCGLGARDTLRLEVCYPLHGNDITPETDAISAGLGWVCALDKEFIGVEELRRVQEAGPEWKLAAFVMSEKAIPRHGMPIEGGGEVTSGTHSPMLDAGIGLGYVRADAALPDTEITIDVRGRPRRARIVRKPIYKREEN